MKNLFVCLLNVPRLIAPPSHDPKRSYDGNKGGRDRSNQLGVAAAAVVCHGAMPMLMMEERLG